MIGVGGFGGRWDVVRRGSHFVLSGLAGVFLSDLVESLLMTF